MNKIPESQNSPGGWKTIGSLMDAIAAGKPADRDNAVKPRVGFALGVEQEVDAEVAFYRRWFPGRYYPFAQALLNTPAATDLLPEGYLYGTSVLVAREPADVRLLHLLDSERFLYFRVHPEWLNRQDTAALDGHLIKSIAEIADAAVEVGTELRQVVNKYVEYLPQHTAGGRGLTVAQLREFLKRLEESILVRSPDDSDDRRRVRSFALLDIFDLHYALQLRRHAPAIRHLLTGFADRAATDNNYVWNIAPEQPEHRLLLPHWCSAGKQQPSIVLFPFASQGFQQLTNSDDVVFIGFLDSKPDPTREQADPTSVVKAEFRTVAALIIGTSLNELRRLSVLHEARHSAIAAIIGRNMSHNVGSHVLHWVAADHDAAALEATKAGAQDTALEELFDAAFLRYLRERMDYVATATKRIAWWSTSAAASELMTPLIAPIDEERDTTFPSLKRVLDNIGRSDQLPVVSLTADLDDDNPYNVALPHGAVGRQAFYTILENIIRNTAKHGLVARGSRSPSFRVRFSRDVGPDLFKVTITDGITRWDDRLVERLREAVNEDICDSSGRPMVTRLGFKEMKISAAFLRMIDPFRVDDVLDPPLMTFERVDDRVAHVFYLRRSREILIVDTAAGSLSAEVRKDCASLGLDIIDSSGDLPSETLGLHRFTVLLGRPDRQDDMSGWVRRNRCEPPTIDCLAEASPTSGVRRLPLRCLATEWAGIGGVPWLTPTAASTLTSLVDGLRHDASSEKVNEISRFVYDCWLEASYGPDADADIVFYQSAELLGGREDAASDTIAWPAQFMGRGVENVESVEELARLAAKSAKQIGVFGHHLAERIAVRERQWLSDQPNVRMTVSFSGGSALGRFLGQSEKPESAEMFFRELQEAVMARVLIIDERLSRSDLLRSHPEKVQRERETARWAGIVLIGDEIVDAASAPAGRVTINWSAPGLNVAGVESDQSDYAYASIHYGLIEKISERFYLERGDCVEQVVKLLSRVARHVIIHSGRGRPDNLAGARFLDYSSLESWFQDDKRTLVIGLGGL